MTEEKSTILSANQIFRILKRISVEIYENNLAVGEIVLVGVFDQGYRMAEYIKGELVAIDPSFKTTLVRLDIDKSNTSGDIKVDSDLSLFSGKHIVLVDDVLNTSRTLAYSLKFLLQTHVEQVETAVLINRSHASFPISATYSGYELATTLDEHIQVQLEGEIGAFLF